MKFKSKLVGKIVVITISGDITSLSDSRELIDTVQDKIGDSVRSVIFDMTAVNYINSAGINVLITALTSVRNKEGELVLASISEKVKSLLIITKLNSIFNVKESVEESLQFLMQLEKVSAQQENN